MKLFLQKLSVHPSQKNIACAYVYYHNNDNDLTSRDPGGNLITKNYKHFAELELYLKYITLPALSNGFNKNDSNYCLVGVESLQSSALPFLAIARKDKKNITLIDINEIKILVSKLVDSIILVNPSQTEVAKPKLYLQSIFNSTRIKRSISTEEKTSTSKSNRP